MSHQYAHVRIGLDCRLSGPAHAGIGRYISNLMTRLPSLAPEITWVYFIADIDQGIGLEKLKNVELILSPIRHYSIAEQVQLPEIFKVAQLDLLHVPHFNVPLRYQGKLIVTIHDLLWHEYRGTQVTTLPATLYWFKYWIYRWVATQAIRHAGKILVPAEVIKQIIGKYYPDVLNKVIVTKEGVTPAFSARDSSEPLPFELPTDKKILLYVGSLYPHKNVSLIVRALKQLPQYHLVIVGARNSFQEQLQAVVASENVVDQVSFLGYVKDQHLVQLMRRSWALVQPSLSEGFGLTGIEAMAAGLPLIASKIPVFEEIYGSAAILFDPQRVDSFVAAAAHLTAEQRKGLIEKGKAQAKLYDWDEMAQATLDQYHQLLHV